MQTNVNHPNDILIVGAGPVGLMMAAELHRHGVRCRLVERLPQRAPYCKALGIMPRTLEMWDDLGIIQQTLSAGLGLKGAINVVAGDVNQQEKLASHCRKGRTAF